MTYDVEYSGSATPLVMRKVGNGGESGMGWLRRDAYGPEHDQHAETRSFTVLADGGIPLAFVRAEQYGSRTSGQPTAYRVLDHSGASLGRITYRRRPAFRICRTRWTLEPAAGPALRGFAGRPVWWAVWWPTGMLLRWICIVMALLAADDGGFRPPRRVTWRDGSGRAALVFRGMAEDYRVWTGDLDPRLITALVALHQSFDWPEEAGAFGWYGA
ncbi:hypothetical protein [Streptomyces sp. NBC_01244]|uniref:hypothetical protein n=1 Tax=Streptomyces sp. NBC_01244 TaxID=2903797 RepID=UPI002E166708|nr:hypothetical protein OG247_42165 [Streptomyces sp. NBC_01244]